jgi:beta-lactamase class A
MLKNKLINYISKNNSLVLVIGLFLIGVFCGFYITQSANALREDLKSQNIEIQDNLRNITTMNEEFSSKLKNLTVSWPGSVSILIKDLDSNQTLEINTEQTYVSASFYKLFLGYQILDMDDKDQINLEDALNSEQTFNDCLANMITISDNDCAIALEIFVGPQVLDNFLASQGFQNTKLNNYNVDGTFSGDKTTTVQDVSLLLEKIYKGVLLSSQSTDLFISLLEQQQINDRIPDNLPDGVTIAHKTANLDDVFHDAGYIFSPSGNYSYVIMSSGWSDALKQAPASFIILQELIITSLAADT